MSVLLMDPAESSEASYEDHPIDRLEPEVEAVPLRLKVAEWIVNETYNSTNRELAIESLALACGWTQAQGVSQTDAARKLGITRAAMSKHVNRWREKLGLEYGPGFRSGLSRRKGKLNNRRWLPNDEKSRS